MDEHDTPIQTTNPGTAPGRRGARRAISALLLSAGLLAVGGTAAVLAADPTPTPAASSSTAPTDGGATDEDTVPGRGGNRADCPAEDAAGGDPTTGSPDAESPATPDDTASPDASADPADL